MRHPGGRETSGGKRRAPLVASVVLHAGLLILIGRAVALERAAAPRPGAFRSRVRAETPPLPEPPPVEESAPPPAAETPLPALPPEEPPAEPDPPRETSSFEIPTARVDTIPYSLSTLAVVGNSRCPNPRRRTAPPAPPIRPAPRPVRKPAPGPTLAAAPAQENEEPLYPRGALDRGVEGTVLLLVTVRSDGSVAQVEIRETSGHPLLDREAVRTVRGWRFDPALRAGRPVASRVEVPVLFTLG